MTVDIAQIDALLRNQRNFVKLVSSHVFMQSLRLAIGDFMDLKTLLTLRFVEGCSIEQLADYYQVKTSVIEDWLGKIYRITAALIRKNIICLE